MENSLVSINRIKRAEMRYYERNKNGVAIPNIKAYAILIEVNGVYVNIVKPFKEYNVWGRLPYTNSTMSGEDFGTKITLLSGKDEDGVCYVLDSVLPMELINLAIEDTNNICINDIYRYIANSNDFYFDRAELLTYNPRLVKYGMAKKIIDKDIDMQHKFLDELTSGEKVYKKAITSKLVF